MIWVDGKPVAEGATEFKPRDLLRRLVQHPLLVESANSLKAADALVRIKAPIPSGNNGDEESSVDGGHVHAAGPKFVYFFQKEFGTVSPENVELVGTDEMTTCVGVVIRDVSSGLISVGHFDSADYAGIGVTQMLQSLGATSPTKFQIHLVGAYDESGDYTEEASTYELDDTPSGYSEPLAVAIIEAFQNSVHVFDLKTCCVLQSNTKTEGAFACPAVRGLVVETRSGTIKPAVFEYNARGPDTTVRSICITTVTSDPAWKPSMLSPYNTLSDSFCIRPCQWSKVYSTYAPYMLSLNDEEFLQTFSTSPNAEGPDFVANSRKVFKYILEYPDWRQTFSDGKPREFIRSSQGGWKRSTLVG